MKARNWIALLLSGLMLAWGTTAFAATAADNGSRVLRQPVARGTILEVTLLDTKGLPVAGASITAVRDDLNQVTAVTGPDGVAVLDGLPTDSRGTVQQVKNLRAVNWDIRLQSGKINYLTIRHNTVCYGVNPRKYRNPLIVKLPVHQPRYEQRWAPVSYIGSPLPVQGDKFLDDNWQQLTYQPTGKGQITHAYFRPWGTHEGLAELPIVPWWHISVYTLVNCDKRTASTPQ
jgi:hypothetical protein